MPLNLADKNRIYVIQRIVGNEGMIHRLQSLEKDVNDYNEKHNIKISYARGYEISTRNHYYLMEELTKRADSRMYDNNLTKLGCDIFQEYYFSKPIAVNEFEEKYLDIEKAG